MARERSLHVQHAGAYRFLAGQGPKRSATIVPAPLRYWQYHLPGPVAFAFVVAIVVAWLGLFGWVGGWSAARGESPLALLAGLAVLLLSTTRATVTDHGLSFDSVGTRSDTARVIALAQVRELRVGRPPEDWPQPKRRGGWWPGRTRVAVRHLTADGEGAVTLWVRDVDAFAAALGVPVTR